MIAAANPESATERLQQLMATAEIPSFRALSRRAGVSESTIRQLRQGRIAHMRLETLLKIAAALQRSLPALLQAFEVADDVAVSDGAQDPGIAALVADYQRLQAELADQAEATRQALQQEVLNTLEPWLLQWPTVVHAVGQNPDLPASRLLPLVKPVEALLDRWQIERLAAVGETVPYDPQRHELMAGTAHPGDPVRVRYVGYCQGDRLLYRAKVSPGGAE